MLVVALATPAPALAGDRFEPNETVLNAAGPLAAGQSYDADLSTAGDRDFYSLYVTSPGGADVALTVQNLGGGTPDADLNVTVVDAASSPLGAIPYVRHGETRSATVTLDPQKYYVEVTSGEGYGDSYRLTTGDAPGAFGPYTAIWNRCTAAQVRSAVARQELARARGKLQRAVARSRRSRYSSLQARRAARRLLRRARRQVSARRLALSSARASLSPWCEIPQ